LRVILTERREATSASLQRGWYAHFSGFDDRLYVSHGFVRIASYHLSSFGCFFIFGKGCDYNDILSMVREEKRAPGETI
jgi:hypothetical protein